jgi:UDP-glucose:glycoprotein glucosyltransferase
MRSIISFLVLASLHFWSIYAEPIFDIPSPNNVEISLNANWSKTPFKLNVLEGVAAINESLYEPLVLKLLDIELDEENNEFIMTEELTEISDADYYNYAINLLNSDVDKYLANIQISNNLLSARIQAHFQYYNSTVKQTHDCERDVVLYEPFGFDYHCDAEAAFMLKLSDYVTVYDEFKLPFDRLIGSSITPKAYVIYGDYKDDYFRRMFLNMYQFASTGKLNIVWRYVNSNDEIDKLESLSGYGVALNLKRTDYIAIDDRGFTSEQQQRLNFDDHLNSSPEHIDAEKILESHYNDITKVEESDVQTLGLKATKFILDSKNKITTLAKVISEFPKYAYQLSKLNYTDDELFQILKTVETSMKSYIPSGIYINNAVIPAQKTDIFEIFNTIKKELSFINYFKNIGLDYKNSQNLITNFATSMLSLFRNPSRRYDLSNFQKTIVYLNDIEFEQRYKTFKDPKIAYQTMPPTGKLPNARENIHQMIFVADLSNLIQLSYILQFYQQVILQKLPIQIGIIPLSNQGDWTDKIISKLFGTFHEKGPEEAFNFLSALYNFFSSEQPPSYVSFKALNYPDLDKSLNYRYTDNLENIYQTFDFSNDSPTIIANGIMFSFSEIDSALNQIFEDMVYLYGSLHNKKISENTTLSKFLRKNSIRLRDNTLVPDTISQFKNQYIRPAAFIDLKHWQAVDTLKLVKDVRGNEAMITINLIGSFTNEAFVNQIVELLSYFKNARGIKIVVNDIFSTKEFKKCIRMDSVDDQIAYLKKTSYGSVGDDFEVKDSIRIINENFDIVYDHTTTDDIYLVVAGRKILVKELISTEKISSIVHFERFSRLSTLKKLYKKYTTTIKFTDEFDKFELFSWMVSYSYFFPATEKYFANTLPRISLDALPLEGNISEIAKDELLNVQFVIDPVSEDAQRLISFIPLFQDLEFVSLHIHLIPTPSLKELPIKRLYKALVNINPLDALDTVKFIDVPEKTLFNVELDEPQRWLVAINKASTDLDNLKLDLTSTNSASGSFILKNILVEGYASYYEGKKSHSPAALPLELVGQVNCDTNVMTNLGYFQLKANPGIWELKIKEFTKGSLVYELPENIKFGIINLDGVVLSPVFTKQWGMETISLIEKIDGTDDNQSLFAKWYIKGLMLINDLISPKKEQADINIFTVASGHLYERFLGIMIASVMKNTGKTVKFWLIENFISPDFKAHLPILASQYGFEFELIMYKWPIWLNHQRERQRTIWGFKILFLDVLFPQDLDKVIFVDSDQIIRTDLQELVDIDLNGAPYGYTPMCDSRREMEGFRFWKQGYWERFLGDEFKYHISALYVVDLLRFRSIAAGDILRHHYHQLSQDPNSLSNLDQDLPNNLQQILRIHSLPQEWLWCETWCSDESLEDAKTIDLCNNPLTKEPKLERAKRQIKEWVELDEEVSALINGNASLTKKEIFHDEL